MGYMEYRVCYMVPLQGVNSPSLRVAGRCWMILYKISSYAPIHQKLNGTESQRTVGDFLEATKSVDLRDPIFTREQ